MQATLYNSQHLLPWLRDCLRAVSTSDDVDAVANTVADSHGCYFMPTSGASSHGPLERQRCRHVNLWGVSLTDTRPGHVVRAALEAVAAEVAQLLASVAGVVGRPYVWLHVGGRGLQRSDAFCQLLADYTGLRVERLAMSEAVILGGALVAVIGASLDPSGLQGPVKESFACLMVPGERSRRLRQWVSLAGEQELLDHRYWIGSGDQAGDIASADLRSGALQARNKKFSFSHRNWAWRFLSVIMIGTPFTLIGFAAALLVTGSRGRLNKL